MSLSEIISKTCALSFSFLRLISSLQAPIFFKFSDFLIASVASANSYCTLGYLLLTVLIKL